MTENEVWAYLEEIAKSGSILGLASMRRLMDELSNVQNHLKYIHVAGTNGKGSVCAMLSSVLMQAGIRVGKYTSPAVFDRMEQYQINGKNITISEFTAVISEVRDACGRMIAKGMTQPTVFEVETAAAFLYFYRQKCQVVVLETGMGGETDATNIIEHPLVSVLTSISMDHMKFLGNDLTQIARVKAGIIKEGCPVIAVKPHQEAVQKVIEEACREKLAELKFSEVEKAAGVRYSRKEGGMRQHFSYSLGNLSEISLSMMGDYQVENAVCALETINILRNRGFVISDEEVYTGLLQARWEGRFSVLCEKPLFVMDGAHNADAAKKLRETLKRGFTNCKIIYIIGVLADKEHEEMLKIMLPMAHQVYTLTPDNPRAMSGQALAVEAGKYHEQVSYCATAQEAVERAFSIAGQKDAMILAFGSLSYLKKLRDAVKEKLYNGR